METATNSTETTVVTETKEDLVTAIENEVIVSQNKNLSIGKSVLDIRKSTEYRIKELRIEGIVLEHKPFFKNERQEDLAIGYDEFIMAFEKERFEIDGFNKEDAPALKRAVRDVIKDIEHKDELRKRIIEERDTQKKLEGVTKTAEQLQAEKDKLLAKKRSRVVVKGIRKDEEAFRKALDVIKQQQKEEQERLDAIRLAEEEELRKQEEERIRLAQEEADKKKKAKILNAKVISQQQRIRFSVRKSL